jgi:Na+/H+-dicarboxylate symporter
VGALTDFLHNIIPTTFVDPFVKAEVLQILFVAVLFGLGLYQIGERRHPGSGCESSSSVPLRAMSIFPQNCEERHQSLWLI